MRKVKLVILVIIVIVFSLFVFQNIESVQLMLFKWELKLPLSLVITLFYILGMFTGGLLISNLKKLSKEALQPDEKKKDSR